MKGGESLGYLTKFTEQGGMSGAGRVSCENYARFLDNLTRLMNVKQTMLSKCGICHSEVMLMFVALDYAADNYENITVAEAARRLGVSMPAASRSLKGLSEKGFVKRGFDENDRRSVRIAVTETGEEKVRSFLRFAFATLDKALAVFSDRELVQMMELQNRFVNSLITTLKGEKNARDKEHN